ncbi:MAG: VOC family protein [Rhodothermales bacterium]
MQIFYLEIVTPDVDDVCATYAKLYGASFGEPIAVLGNARTADLADGGRIGVRAPMGDSEVPLVRPYLLVDDIEATVKKAVESGGEIAHPPFELPGQGTFAIFMQGGIQHGIWQRLSTDK